MALFLKTPRPHKRMAKGMENPIEIVRWSSGVDDRIDEIIASLGQSADFITNLSNRVVAFDSLAPTTTIGDMIYFNGTDNVRLPGGSIVDKQVLQFGSDSIPAWQTIPYEKHIRILNPGAAENQAIWHTPEKIEITEVRGVWGGGIGPSITIDILWDPDRSTAGTSALSAPTAVTSKTTGTICALSATAANRQPTADAFIWMTSSAGGASQELLLSITYKRIF